MPVDAPPAAADPAPMAVTPTQGGPPGAGEAEPILVLNCGSSSIKFALFDAGQAPLPRTPAWSGRVEGLGGPAPSYRETDAEPEPLDLDRDRPYPSALRRIHEGVQARLGQRRLHGVVHRVVHGGKDYARPVRMDAAVLADLKALIPLAPLHQPYALEAIEALLQEQPEVPQVACFDTAFHHTLPKVEQLLPLPYDAWERGLRRYGFHGLSYAYLAQVLPERLDRTKLRRVVAAHLGSGASLCAMQELESVATTMGFSALDGLMMGTRCGALDPGAVLYLMQVEKLSLEETGRVLYHQSGLLGVSGISPEPRVLIPHEDDDGETGERARIALALYVRRIVRETGALVALLGGLDTLVFTAGIGEHSAPIRERVCRDLAWLGIEIDAAANARNDAIISTPASGVTVVVEPTNEEWIAARDAVELLRASSP